MSWQHTPRARASFDRIHSGAEDLHPWLPIRADGNDTVDWAGSIVRELQATLDAHVAKLFGCTLKEAGDARRHAWMALYRQQPSVQEVLEERFGVPGAEPVEMGRAA